jgi:hypothetical protein
MPFTHDMRKTIITALEACGANKPCPRCYTNSWNLVDGFVNHPLSDIPGQLILGGPSIPVVVVVCDTCGYLAEHAAGKLGLLLLPQEADGRPHGETNSVVDSQ